MIHESQLYAFCNYWISMSQNHVTLALDIERLLLYKIWNSSIETRSISIYHLKKYGKERNRGESNKWPVISRQQKDEILAELHEQKQSQRKQERNISSYKENENTQTSEQVRRRRKRTVLICDDERDLLFMFRITLQESYDVLTAKSGEECIKIYLKAIFRKKD